MTKRISRQIVKELNQALQRLPERFHDSFEYVKRGNNLCHPVTVWLLGKIVASLERVTCVGIDVRLNRGGGRKFQPDVVGFDKTWKPVVYVDFESPNSCDARVPLKDVIPYLKWADAKQPDARPVAPYVIVVSLPNKAVQDWQVRWIAKGQTNYKHRNKVKEIRANPHRYWTKVWSNELARELRKTKCKLIKRHLSWVTVVNINRRSVTKVTLP